MENNQDSIVEIVQGSITNRNVTTTLDDYESSVQNNAWHDEMYRSYYTFDKTFEDHVKKTKSVKGYEGLIHLDRIIIDIDKGNINEDSFQAYILDCITQLLDKGVIGNDINVWFSGTGYHIELLNIFGLQPSKSLNEKLKLTMQKHFDFGDSIYDKARVIRSNWSLNKKENLFKIWLPILLLNELSYDDVKKSARSKEDYMHLATKHSSFWKTLNRDSKTEPYLQSMIVASPTIVTNGNGNKKGDVSTVVSCMQHVFNEGPIKGSRNMKLMRMTSSYKRAGIPFLVTLNGMLTWTNGTLSEKEVSRTVTNVYEGNYIYGCNDTIMAEYCDPKCIFWKRKDYTLDVKSIDQLEENLRDYMKNDLPSKSINLKDIWNVPSFMFKPGELVVVSGDTGVGKSAFVQNIVTKSMKDTLFLSLEMIEELTFRRFVQIAKQKSKEWVENAYQNSDISFAKELKHINIMSIAPKIESVKKVVAEYHPNVLVIDTTDELQVEFVKGEIEKLNIIVDHLKQIAQKNNIIIIAIHHLNKMSAVNNTINLHSLKGSSNIVQKADKVLIVKGNRAEIVRTISSEKSRDENRFEMTAHFDYNTFTFTQIKV